MKNRVAKEVLEEQLARLRTRVESPRVLRFRTDERGVLEQAIERVQAHVLGGPEPILVVALAGGTGAGKSSLINALAGATIAEVSEIRPTTKTLRVYHHREVPADSLLAEIGGEAAFVPHDRPELRTKVLVDTPDLDSFVLEHRALTKQLLKGAGLVLYVLSPEKYLEERTWSVLREEQRFSASAAVLNKVDRVSSPEELELLSADLRRRFADIGLGGIRIFRTCAVAYGTGAERAGVVASPEADDTAALRAFLERELQLSDVARMRRDQQERVMGNLQAVIDRIAPPDALERLEAVAEAASQRPETAAVRLHEHVGERLVEAERELVPLVTLRQHERFWGPFRTWLALADFFRFRLADSARLLIGGAARTTASSMEACLLRGGTRAVDDLLCEEVHALQDLLYEQDLPVDHWRRICFETARITGEQFLSNVAGKMEDRFETAATAALKRGGAVVWLASVLGSLMPAVFVGVGLYVLGRDFAEGRYGGFPLLGHLVAMTTLFFLALQGTIGVLLPGTRRRGRGIGRQAVQAALSQTLAGWLNTYQADLEADFQDLREPVQVLQAALPPSPEIAPPAQDRPALAGRQDHRE